VGFEPTIPASERAKTVHALDLAATVTGHVRLIGETFGARGRADTINPIDKRWLCGKVLFLCLINYALFHESLWESGGTAPPFLTSALDGGE
jgi:hypothetical protein